MDDLEPGSAGFPSASAGFIEITRASEAELAGTYELTFETRGTVSGTFSGAPCAIEPPFTGEPGPFECAPVPGATCL